MISGPSNADSAAPSAPPQDTPARGSGKARRIWRRTWVGALLAGVVAGLLAGAWSQHGGALVWLFGSLVALGCCAEIGRLGSFAGRGLAPPLLAAGAVIVAAHGRELADGPELSLGWRYLEALLFAVCVGAATRGSTPARTRTLALLAALVGVGFHLLGPRAELQRAALVGLTLPAALLALRLWTRPDARDELRLLAFLALWLVVPSLGLLHVWWGYGAAGLTALVILSKIGDVFGYYVGSALGRTHPFPRISPGKTTAGCVGSLVAALVVGALLVPAGLLPDGRLGIWGGVLAGLVTNLAAQAGDLLESKVKRTAGVKDSGSWFGPAGGLLDLVDSLLLSAPVALLAWPWILGET